MFRAILPLLLAAAAVCQDAAERCATALLRGDRDAAAIAATSATDPAMRARLQAALLTPSRRPAAMLAAAARFPDSAQADLAILAGAAAALSLRDRGKALPQLTTWHELEDQEDDWGWLPVAVVEGLWRQLEQRRARGGDLTILAEAEQLLQRCCISRFGFEPTRVAPQGEWLLPPRREPLRLRAWRRQPGTLTWADAVPSGPADRDELLEITTNTIRGLPSGDWLVELASTSSRWRGVRAVEVSDLDVIALVDRDRAALAAWRGRQPIANADWWLSQPELADLAGPKVTGKTSGVADLLVAEELAHGGELFVTVDDQKARVAVPWARQRTLRRDRWQPHLMLDRPIYRPGDRIQGRLLLRETTYEGEGLDAVLTSAPAAGQDVVLRVFEGGDQIERKGRTDQHGIWSFDLEVPDHADQGSAQFALHLPDHKQPIHRSHPCQIADFQRAALLLEVAAAARLPHGEDTTASMHAAWASGAPASGMLVDATVRVWPKTGSSIVEQHKLATDANGKANLQLPLARLAAEWVRVDFQVETPNGPKKVTHSIDTRPIVERPEVEERSYSYRSNRAPHLVTPDAAIVSEPCPIGVRGQPGQRTLVVIGRGSGSRARSVQLDDRGEAEIRVVPTRAEWPALDLAVAGQQQSRRVRIPLELRKQVQPEITLPETAAPGSQVACTVATGIASTAVTIAVVDERVYAIASDRTADPDDALRPSVARPDWRHAASVKALTPEQFFAPLLEQGVIPPSGLDGDVDPSRGAAGAAGPAASGIGQIRSEFRATATFATAIADADGVATFAIALPDDLTTWRATIIGVAPDGMGFRERRHLVTRVPLAAEPVLPRVLRVGDSVDMPIVVDRKEGTGNAAAVSLSAACSDASATIQNGEHELPLAGGSAASALVTLQGRRVGSSKLSLAANVGDFEDRSQRAVAVRADAVLRQMSAAAMATGEVALTTPEELVGPVEVTVLGGSSASWAALEQRLTSYPYGCVEQTLARLLPFCAAVRAAKVHGTEPPARSEEFQQRLRAGLRRMRQLQAEPGGAFSFWPGGRPDHHMTALVLHGLAVMRAGGIDPARFGLTCDVTRQPFADAVRALAKRNGEATTAEHRTEVELVSACLRTRPDNERLRAVLVAAVSRQQPLPAGLLLRAGLALAAAGDAEHAGLCLQRATRRAREAKALAASSSLPGEDALAVRALELELHCVLQPDAPPAALAAEVLLDGLNGYSTTYAQACALAATSLAMPKQAAKPFAVELRIDGKVRELQLDADNGFTQHVRVAAASRCSLTGPEGQLLIVHANGHRREAGSDHKAWSNPLVVTRELCRRDPRATVQQRRKGEDLVPVEGSLVAGEVLWLRLRVHAPRTLRYVVVDCPLPAGFEPVQELAHVERFDDRIAMTCSRVGEKAHQFLIPLVPTLSGTMVWPPTIAEPMYADGLDGGTAGSKLTVVHRTAPVDRPTEVACFATPRPQREPTKRKWTARDRVDVAMSDLREAFDRAHLPEHTDGLATALAAAMRACDALLGDDAEPDYVLDELTDTLRSWRDDLAEQRVEDACFRARTSALLTVAERQHACVFDSLQQFEQASSNHHDYLYVETLTEALVAWPERQMREAMLAKVLSLAVARNAVPHYVLEDIDGPVEDDDLRAVLMVMLASHAEDHGEELVRLLPREDLQGTAPAVLIAACDDYWPDWLPGMLMATPLGRAELARCVQDPRVVAEQVETLVANLPRSFWRGQPLRTFALLDRQYVADFSVPSALAASTHDTASLQRELVATTDADWQATLARALVVRGVRTLGGAVQDAAPNSLAPKWQDALASSTADADRALALIAEHDADPTADALVDFLRDVAVAIGTPQHLARLVAELDDEQIAAMLRRLTADEQRQLLTATADTFAPLPTPRTAADCAALWAYAERLDEVYEVLAACVRSDVGLTFATGKVDALPDAELRAVLREYLFELQELDPETGRAPTDEPWLPLLHAVALRGVSATWSQEQRRRFDALRRLRGVR